MYPVAFHAGASTGIVCIEPSYLVWPAVVQHIIDPLRNAALQRRTRIHHKIARPPTGSASVLAMQLADAPSGEQRDLDGAQKLGTPQVRARRIERRTQRRSSSVSSADRTLASRARCPASSAGS